jgi:hypothetical protein
VLSSQSGKANCCSRCKVHGPKGSCRCTVLQILSMCPRRGLSVRREGGSSSELFLLQYLQIKTITYNGLPGDEAAHRRRWPRPGCRRCWFARTLKQRRK